MQRAYKYRIYPTEEQEVLLVKTFGCVRVVWNWALDVKSTAYKEQGESISTNTLVNRMKAELKAERLNKSPQYVSNIVNGGKNLSMNTDLTNL